MYDDSVKTGKFNERNKLPKTIEIWRKNILIAGFGRIGQCLIKRCLESLGTTIYGTVNLGEDKKIQSIEIDYVTKRHLKT